MIVWHDYTSSGSVQVEVFSDRLVIRNPGRINPAIKKEDLFMDHPPCPNNALIADQLYTSIRLSISFLNNSRLKLLISLTGMNGSSVAIFISSM